MADHYHITRYRGGRNAEIVALILAIQRDDVGLDVPIEQQPELRDIAAAYASGGFWLATHGSAIVGTVGVLRYGYDAVLKKLFVRCDHRGGAGAAHLLHQEAINWVRARPLRAVYLDTPAVATRSHAFYRAKGYRIVDRAELPSQYSFPDRDSLIFKLDLRG